MNLAQSPHFPAVRLLAAVLMAAGLLVAPFAAMELLNTPGGGESFPSLLFSFMFVHAALIALAFAPAVLQVVRGRGIRELGLPHWAGVAVGCLLFWAYGAVVADQMPCFLGVPHCD